MVTLAVISDTHLPRGRRRLPDACLQRIATAEGLLHAGDVTSGAFLDELLALGRPLHAVAGNVDDADVCTRLPATAVVEVGSVRIAIVHDAGAAAGRLDRLRRRFGGCDAVVFGHSHIPLLETDDRAGNPFSIFNPGSPTDPRRQPRPTMGMLCVDGGRLRFELVAL